MVPCFVSLVLESVSGRNKNNGVYAPRPLLSSFGNELTRDSDQVVIVPRFAFVMLKSASGRDKDYVVFVPRSSFDSRG